jgi:hypothetical protein
MTATAALTNMPLAGAYVAGARDENRTRTISLGSRPIHAATAADLPGRVTAGVRDCPLVTLANCTLIAR